MGVTYNTSAAWSVGRVSGYSRARAMELQEGWRGTLVWRGYISGSQQLQAPQAQRKRVSLKKGACPNISQSLYNSPYVYTC